MAHEQEIDESYIDQNMRPSYMNFEDSNMEPNIAPIDAGLARKLDDEFLLEVDDEKIRTFLRLRPPSSKKLKNNNNNLAPAKPIFAVEGNSILKVDARHLQPRNYNKNSYQDESRFTFSKVMGPECSQSTVFEECVQPILESFFRGENCLIFSYGATNSGKTYTMQGYGTNFGIVPRTLDHLFNFLEDKLYAYGNIKPSAFNAFLSLSESESKNIDETKLRIMKEVKTKSAEMTSFRNSFVRSSFCANSTISDDVININSVPLGVGTNEVKGKAFMYAVWVSFAEIYNERVYDLFETVTKGKRRKELKIINDKDGNVYIKDLTEVCANNAEEAYQLFLAGKANLQFAATHVNSNSSRSHSFFNIRMVSVGMSDRNAYPRKVFQMSFCDLAGIERVAQTHNVGARLKESGSINQSLFVLLKCIRLMRDRQNKNKRVDLPQFRESKLARLFQGYLKTASHICMIVNVNPDPEMLDSSLHVLQNSAICSEVITYRQVEPPLNDSNFCRKVRASIGMAENLVKKQLALHSESLLEEEEDTDDEYACETVVAQSKLPGKRLIELEEENRKLREELREIEDKTRKEMAKKFGALIEKQGAYYKEVVQYSENSSEVVHDRRISFAAKVVESGNDTRSNDSTEDISSASFRSSCTDDCSTIDYSSNQTSSNLLETPGPVVINYKAELQKEQERNNNLASEIEDLREVCRAVQRSFDERNMQVAKLQLALKDKEAKHVQQIEKLEHLLKLKDEELEQVKAKDPTKMKDEGLLQHQKLTQELSEQHKINAQLQAEIEDATRTCIEYDEKLNEANEKTRAISREFNALHAKNQELQEENELMHLSVDDYEIKLKMLENELKELRAQQNEETQDRKRSRRRL